MEWEVLKAEGFFGGILVLWNSRLCVAFEVNCDRHSITLAFFGW